MSRETHSHTEPGQTLEQLILDIKDSFEAFTPTQQHFATEMISQSLQILTESHELHDLTLISTTLKELRLSFKLFGPYRDTRKICIFGSARTAESDPNYQLALEFSYLIAQKGWMVITGAGPGIMEAGNRGTPSDMSFGVNIKLPFEQDPNPYIAKSSKLASFKYFFNRKLTFLRESDATILFPGGFGTHDEGFEVLTLIQTGRCAPRPLILIAHEKDTYWKTWETFVTTELCNQGYISSEDMALFTRVETAKDAVAHIENFYRVFHSIRYFNEMAVIRLNQKINSASINKINDQFSDLCIMGKIELCDPDQFTLDRNDYSDKYRLIFKFDKIAYGRLTQLIQFINTL